MQMVPELFGRRRVELLAPVSRQDFLLLVGEIVGAHLAVSAQVDKQLLGVNKIAVYIVEIAQYHLAPEQEAVKVGDVVADGAVFVVEREELVEPRRLRKRGQLGGDIADCSDGGEDERLPLGQRYEMMAEKDSRTLVGEDETIVHHPRGLMPEINPRHLPQERFHGKNLIKG